MDSGHVPRSTLKGAKWDGLDLSAEAVVLSVEWNYQSSVSSLSVDEIKKN
jgi:hypothetical protein